MNTHSFFNRILSIVTLLTMLLSSTPVTAGMPQRTYSEPTLSNDVYYALPDAERHTASDSMVYKSDSSIQDKPIQIQHNQSSWEQNQTQLVEDFKSSSGEAPQKGFGAWLYGEPSLYAQLIHEYNNTEGLAEAHKIRYLFPLVGEIDASTQQITPASGKSSINEWIESYSAQFPDDEYLLYPMLNYHADLLEVGALATNIADVINASSSLDITGWHLDIEPVTGGDTYTQHYANFVQLVDEVKDNVSMPVSIAVTEKYSSTGHTGWQLDNETRKQLFEVSQFVALMMYDYASDINNGVCAYGTEANYGEKALATANAFMTSAKSYGYAMIGVPAVATHHEFEYYEDIGLWTTQNSLDVHRG